MAFRRLLKGEIEEELLDAVIEEVEARYEQPVDNVRILDANNWLSTPMVVNDRYFVKVISRQHALVHALLTAGRNLGAYSSGSEGFFKRFATPLEMAEHELDATERMQEIDVNVPRPVEAFGCEGLGVLVMEYLPEFETLDELSQDRVKNHVVELFASLKAMHEAGFAHGDLRSENVLVSQGDLYFIDATNVDEEYLADARAYDIACALAVLEPLVGAADAVDAAIEVYGSDIVLTAREFLDFVNIRPDHDFDGVSVKGELEKAVER